jgi:hypothetical protein
MGKVRFSESEIFQRAEAWIERRERRNVSSASAILGDTRISIGGPVSSPSTRSIKSEAARDPMS